MSNIKIAVRKQCTGLIQEEFGRMQRQIDQLIRYTDIQAEKIRSLDKEIKCIKAGLIM